MEVPDSMLKLRGCKSDSSSFAASDTKRAEEAGDQAARILTPGAAVSGCTTFINHKHKAFYIFVKIKTIALMKEWIFRTFNTEGDRELGPREKKNATSGDNCCPTTVFVLLNLITGFLQHMHASQDNLVNVP